MSPDWLNINVKTLSHNQLMELLDLLRDSNEHREIQLLLKKELVERVRGRGWTIEQICNYLVLGVVRGKKRNGIAEQWAEPLGITVEEFLEFTRVK